jgi:FkbM family methyltransferase
MKINIEDIAAFHQRPKGLVIDCGGYLGKYTEAILSRFDCRVILFEPIPEYAEICRNKFKDKNVEVIQKAVGKDGEIEISKLGESSSQFKSGEKINVESVSLVPFIRNVDILKLNCEGGEYEVLKDLNEHNLLKDIKEILIQFHKIGEDIDFYRKLLSKTHQQVYCFKWDLWVKK